MTSNYDHLLRRNEDAILTPNELLRKAIAYFEWAESHPLKEEKVFNDKGNIVRAYVDKARAFTKSAMCQHMGISASAFERYKRLEGADWKDAVEIIEDVISNQKFEHAAAGLLNANIIIRDLGLTDKQEVTGKGTAGSNFTLNITPIKSGTFLDKEPKEGGDAVSG